MTPLALAARTAVHHGRSHALALCGLAVAAAVICGSLVIGDSVRLSLHDAALARIGGVEAAVGSGGLLRAGLAERLATTLGADATVAPLLMLRGVAANGEHRANAVQVCGVDGRFWALAPQPRAFHPQPGEVALNPALAAALGARVGDSVLLRLEKPGFLPRDAPLSSTGDATVALRLRVVALLDTAAFGSFSLAASQLATPTAFVALEELQQRAALGPVANLLLVGGAAAGRIGAGLDACWRPDDALVEVRDLGGVAEVRAERIFLEPRLGAELQRDARAAGVLAYFVNELRVGAKATPYSLVAAADWARLPDAGAPLPGDLADDEIAIGSWLADDLAAKPGDRLTLRYFVLADSGALVERSAEFRVRCVVPLAGSAADRELMPHFPGISDAEDCKDWHPGVPIDLKRIRPVDEEYWKLHRGTPKAFISLAAGRRLWANRFGDLTAVRLPGPAAAVEQRLRAALAPADLGLHVIAVRGPALAASAKAMDFSGLFLGLGLFLVAAALVLAGLLVALGLARRRTEVGVLLALGFRPRSVARLLVVESALVALAGSMLGAALGCGYAALVIAALGGGWSAAVGAAGVQLHVLPTTLVAGAAASALVAAAVLWWRVRRLHREPLLRLLAGRGGEPSARASRRWPAVLAVLAALGAVALAMAPGGGEAAVARFFAAGVLALAAGACAVAARLGRRRRRGLGGWSLAALAATNAARSGGRSLAVVMVLACACFLVVAVGANRRDPLADATSRAAGTGGFALIAESSVAVTGDFGAAADRERLGIDDLADAAFVALRVGSGDDASCLNLNHSAAPRIFGVDPAALAERGAFTFSAQKLWTFTIRKPGDERTTAGWGMLDSIYCEGIPAIADENTARWSLGLEVGDSLTVADEAGRPFRITLVGTLAPSLLQGGLLISERNFVAKFPGQGGHRSWLIDAPPARAAAVAAELERALADFGLVATPAATRLAAYLAVERVYLDIFLTLGGLALLLGSAGVGVVVARNVLDRVGELAAARAIGFTRRALFRLILLEHAALLAGGLAVGALAGALAVWPALAAPGAAVPWLELLLAFAAILASGVAWIAVATRRALAGTTVQALRKE